MEFTKEMKMLEQRRILRLVCYKSQKVGKPIAECCPFKFSELNETCKNCVWFQIVDESAQVKGWLREREIKPGQPVVFDLKEIVHDEPPKLDYMDRLAEERGI